ncbi:MAG: hypothetical protein ACOCXJ_02350 [Planctomycetota bacterium]
MQHVRGGPVVLRASADATAVEDPDLRAALRLIAAEACAPLDVSTLCRRLGIGRRTAERPDGPVPLPACPHGLQAAWHLHPPPATA